MIDDVLIPNDYRVCAAGRGASWWREFFALYTRQTGAMTLLCVIFSAIFVALWILGNITPTLLGLFISAVSTLLGPVFAASFMVSMALIARGEELDISHLFSGFRQLRPLLRLGALMMLIKIAGIVILSFAASSMLVNSGVDLHLINGLVEKANNDPFALAEMLQQTLGATLIVQLSYLILIALLFYALLLFGFSFAPGLIALGKRGFGESVRLSMRAVFANWKAFTVYGLISMALMLVATITLVGAVLIFPLMLASLYPAYRDVFSDLPDQLDADLLE